MKTELSLPQVLFLELDEKIIFNIKSRIKLEDYDPILFIQLIHRTRIDLISGCWLRGKDWSQYSTVKKIPAHRLSYWLFTGRKPNFNRFICHNCDRRGCWNPDHLFQGTASDNIQDARKKHRVFSVGPKKRKS